VNREPRDVLEDVRAAVHAGSAVALFDLLTELMAGLCMYAQFPEEAFDLLVSLLGDPVCWAHEGAWELVKEVDASWELLSVEQRSKLRPLLAASFDKWSNPMGAFVIGELLGGRYRDEEALNALTLLTRTAAMPARALVPHGLETLARGTDNERLKQRAISMLRELKEDAEAQVREEACIALRKVGAPL
jgi:hypothetical protein